MPSRSWVGLLDELALSERLGEGAFTLVAARFCALQAEGVRLEPVIDE